MKRHLLIVVLLAAGVIAASPLPQLFEGQLEEAHYKAPEFPSPVPSAPEAVPAPQAGAPAPAPGGLPSQETTQPEQQTPLNSTGTTWINSRPLTMSGLRGKVILIDFWEYTCINCIRTFANNKKWYERYRRDGFVLIGVHDPEFHIAYSVNNVRRAVKRFGIIYPVVVDDKFMIWNSYHSNSWPNRYLIDANGYVRYHRVGEGGDAAFEQAIQKLLAEAHPGLKFPSSYVTADDSGDFSPACGVPTDEMYVGDWYGRGILANPEGYHDGKTVDYKLPGSVADGRVILGGRWQTDKNGMIFRSKKRGTANGELVMRYHARELYSVMNVARDRPEALYITQDGKNLTSKDKGVDVRFDSQGRSYIEVREPRMYYLVENPSFGSHEVRLTPSAPGATINSFTFGNNCQTDFPHL